MILCTSKKRKKVEDYKHVVTLGCRGQKSCPVSSIALRQNAGMHMHMHLYDANSNELTQHLKEYMNIGLRLMENCALTKIMASLIGMEVGYRNNLFCSNQNTQRHSIPPWERNHLETK